MEAEQNLIGKHVRYKGVTYRVISWDEAAQVLELVLPLEKPFKVKRNKVIPLTVAEETELAVFLAGHSKLHSKLVAALSARL
jgi:hypothetical protein